MHVGVAMFCTDYAIAPTELAMALEARGFESLWLPEHSHIPLTRTSPFPQGGDLPKKYYDVMDPFVVLGAVAAVTTRLKIATGICLVPQRDPIQTAKSVATIDQISAGRAQVGIGAGWSVREHAAYGIRFPPLAERMDLLDEAATCLRLLLRQDEAEFSGRFFQLSSARLDPRPVQDALPIWIGGAGERRTLPIAARLADGWNAPFLSPEDFGRKRRVLHVRRRPERAVRPGRAHRGHRPAGLPAVVRQQ